LSNCVKKKEGLSKKQKQIEELQGKCMWECWLETSDILTV
jgi:hypothetical protein